MCTCVCVNMCGNVYLCVCAYMCVYVGMYICVCIYVCICVGVYIYVCAYMCVYVCMHPSGTQTSTWYLLPAPFSISVFEVSL